MNGWFAASVTDSFHAGHSLPLLDGLAFIDGSACPHHDGEHRRRPACRRLVADGGLPGGYAADDGATPVSRSRRRARRRS